MGFCVTFRFLCSCGHPRSAHSSTYPPAPTHAPPTRTRRRLLWFKRRLPRYATRFIEMCVVLCADHGPCVSGGRAGSFEDLWVSWAGVPALGL